MVAPKDPKKREEWLFKLQHQSDILNNNISCANIVLSMIEKKINGYVNL